MAETSPAETDGTSDAFAERVLRYLDGTLPDEGVVVLNRELSADPARRARFVRLCLIESLAVEELSPQPQAAPVGEEASEPELAMGWSPPVVVSRRPVKRRAMSFRWAAAAVLALAVGVAALYRDRWGGESDVVVATVSNQVAARWDGAAMPVKSAIHNHQSRSLAAGLVELTFGGGAKVILEGPAKFTLDSTTAMTLSSGKLAAVVRGSGFVVRTPNATLTDLGTEFGVATEPDGSTRLDVFKGAVRAQRAGKSGASTRFTDGQAAQVSSAGVTADPAGAIPQRFVRSLAQAAGPLDVADLLSGGDGTTHRRGGAIDVTSGRSGKLDPVAALAGDHHYHRVPALPVVDGCFVPDGSAELEPIDSAGHTFAFPATSNESFNHLWAGGKVPWEIEPATAVEVLGGVDYSLAGHGLLFMHSNKGLTLDLAVLKRLHPGRVPARWSCVIGNSFRKVPGKAAPLADFFLLVDGKVRFEKRGFGIDGAFPADVPLEDADRFLTIAVTDGGDGHNRDWVIVGDPVIDVK